MNKTRHTKDQSDTGTTKQSILDSYISIRVSYRLILILACMPYLIWEIYWAHKAGYAFIKWHTHLAVYVYLWIIFYVILYGIHLVFHLSGYVKYQMAAASILGTFLLLEVALAVIGIGDTYSEKIGQGYSSCYDARSQSYYHVYKPKDKHYIKRSEFTDIRQCNSLGYSDIEWPVKKKPGEKRIMCFGDSFTEGVGAPYDSCYVSILRSRLEAIDTDTYVMNAGISGDDPCINFHEYKDNLEKFKPDIIVQTLSSNDINTDMAVKGGMERFRPDKTVAINKAPWWEPIYALSYVSRIFFQAAGYNALLLKSPFPKSKTDDLNLKAKNLFSAYNYETKKNGAKLIIVLQPYEREIIEKKYEYDFSEIINHLKTLDNVKVYDLLPFYSNKTGGNKDSLASLYWKQDAHHNPKGYDMMAAGINAAIDSISLDK